MEFARGHWYERPEDAEPDWPAEAIREVDRTFMHPIELMVRTRGTPLAGELREVKGEGLELEGLIVMRVSWDHIEAFMLVPDAPPHARDEARGES